MLFIFGLILPSPAAVDFITCCRWLQGASPNPLSRPEACEPAFGDIEPDVMLRHFLVIC